MGVCLTARDGQRGAEFVARIPMAHDSGPGARCSDPSMRTCCG
jgi:hypothetical protein